jgi:hypothetical protein
LALAAGERDAAFADGRGVALGHFENEFLGVGEPGGGAGGV